MQVEHGQGSRGVIQHETCYAKQIYAGFLGAFSESGCPSAMRRRLADALKGILETIDLASGGNGSSRGDRPKRGYP